MAMSKNLKKQWRVQVRKSRAHKWVNKGLFETRSVARDVCMYYRTGEKHGMHTLYPFGFGNTRVVPYVKGGSK